MMQSHLSRRAALKLSAAGSAFALAACGGRDQSPSSGADLGRLDAVATASAIRNGEVTAAESIAAAIDRAEAANPEINAIVTPYFDGARERAVEAGAGPWLGVPSFIKDLNNVIGQRTTYGSRAFANNIAASQSAFIDAYLGSGMISLGKSSTPEFGLNATTETALMGDTRNPWNLDHSSGGSSGGAAALVAAGVVPVAHASDGGGSIRIPAACCGLVGLKPSRYRTPDPERRPDEPIRVSEHGIVSRSVRDTAAFMAMIELESDLAPVGLVEGPGESAKKIAFHTDGPAGLPVDDEVADAVRATAAALEELGHEVTEISHPFPVAISQDFGLYWSAGANDSVGRWEQAAGRKAGYGDFEPWTFGLIEYFQSRKEALPDAVARLLRVEEMWSKAFLRFDVLLSPVTATPAPVLGHLSPMAGFPIIFDRISAYSQFTHFANVAGAPAISLPMAQSSAGLPIGVMLAGAHGDEKTLIELSYALEEARPWEARRPEIGAS